MLTVCSSELVNNPRYRNLEPHEVKEKIICKLGNQNKKQKNRQTL